MNKPLLITCKFFLVKTNKYILLRQKEMSRNNIKKSRRRKSPESYRKRSYRQIVDPAGLVSSVVRVKETDLHIFATHDVRSETKELVYQYRNQLENYIALHPEFLSSLNPLAIDPLAPPIIKAMLKAGRVAEVGPMAAVAGSVAEFVGRDLLTQGIDEIIIENGGDIFLKRNEECIISIFAGLSQLSQHIGIKVPQSSMPMGICTSSGSVGHSLSFGKADSVTVLSASTPVADAAATRLGNEIKNARDIDSALKVAKTISGIIGVVIICGENLGALGDIELVKLS